MRPSKKLLAFIIFILAFWVLSLWAANKFLFLNPKIPTGVNKTETQTQKVKVVEEESIVIDVVKKVSPSVVSIAVENQQVFNPFGLPQTGSSQQSGIGTGFIISAEGLILTNKHVVSDTSATYVALLKSDTGGADRKLTVKKITRDPFNDLAIIQVDATGLKPVEMGDSDKLQVGQIVIAIGNALGQYENTVTTGVVSGLGRGASPVDPSTGLTETLDDLIQTDAAINPGNSGGPLLNSAGQVIGMNTAVASAENIGFAIKINSAKQLIADFQNSGGKLSRPFLGISYTYVSRDVAILNGVPEGELVRQVIADSSADKAGIEVGDIITLFDGQKLNGENVLTNIIRGKKAGDTVKVRVFRNDQTIDLTVNLGEAPQQ